MKRDISLTLSCSEEQFNKYVQAKFDNALDNNTWSQMTPALRYKISRYVNKLKVQPKKKENK